MCFVKNGSDIFVAIIPVPRWDYWTQLIYMNINIDIGNSVCDDTHTPKIDVHVKYEIKIDTVLNTYK